MTSADEGNPAGVELRLVERAEDWEAYHAIRKRILWDARGQGGAYDPLHPDERAPGHFPFLLVLGSLPVGTVRVDLDPPTAWFRRVAVDERHQRRGYGRKMLELAAAFARGRGCRRVRSSVAATAVEFYRKLGFQEVSDGPPTTSVAMARWL